MTINWNDLTAKVSKYFTVGELTELPRWNAYHIPSEEEKKNLIELAGKMDQIRDIIKAPIKVHVCIRPIKANIPGHAKNGQDYNKLIGGSPKSLHVTGQAMDWSSPGKDCDDVRTLLKPHLESLKMCMEKKENSNWVHLDIRANIPKSGRYFTP
jgi:hypothetical protein